MDLAEAAEQAYAVPPEEFMTVRAAQVAAAKAAGDKALAKQIGALRKPTRSAWLVNLLAREAADEVAALLDLGAALREAQENLDAADLRALSTQRNKTVAALSRRAAALGAAADYSATEAVRQEVAQTLQAALADPSHADDVRRGVLAQAVSYGGFGTFDLSVVPASGARRAQNSTAGPADAAAEKQEREPEPEETPEDVAARESREAAQAAWTEAKEALAAAEAEAEEATAEADGLADQLDELRRQLQDAEKAEAEARRAARAARKHVDELIAAERAAREAAEA